MSCCRSERLTQRSAPEDLCAAVHESQPRAMGLLLADAADVHDLARQ
ncbi:hypothetical protein [Streptomyces sp. HC307]